MSILVDTDIINLCVVKNVVDPFDPTLVNPASLDIRLGTSLEVEFLTGFISVDISDYDESNPFILSPGQFVLAESLETFNLPEDIAGKFYLKSSRAREALEQLEAGWLDPGWTNSKLTMELKNMFQHNQIELYPGMRIGQIVFYQLDKKPAKSYRVTGRYNNDLMVTLSKG